jgi:hypothetical protein
MLGTAKPIASKELYSIMKVAGSIPDVTAIFN